MFVRVVRGTDTARSGSLSSSRIANTFLIAGPSLVETIAKRVPQSYGYANIVRICFAKSYKFDGSTKNTKPNGPQSSFKSRKTFATSLCSRKIFKREFPASPKK